MSITMCPIEVFTLGTKAPTELGSDVWTAGKMILITSDNYWQKLKFLIEAGADSLESSDPIVNSILASLKDN